MCQHHSFLVSSEIRNDHDVLIEALEREICEDCLGARGAALAAREPPEASSQGQTIKSPLFTFCLGEMDVRDRRSIDNNDKEWTDPASTRALSRDYPIIGFKGVAHL